MEKKKSSVHSILYSASAATAALAMAMSPGGKEGTKKYPQCAVRSVHGFTESPVGLEVTSVR